MRGRRGVRGPRAENKTVRQGKKSMKLVRLKVPNHSPADPAGGKIFTAEPHTALCECWPAFAMLLYILWLTPQSLLLSIQFLLLLLQQQREQQ